MKPQLNPPTKIELRNFGLLIAVGISTVFGVLFPVIFGTNIPLWPWITSLVLLLWTLVIPNTLIYLYKPWMRVGLILGRINTHIILFTIFFFVITPYGLVARLFGVRLIKEKINEEIDSYRAEAPNAEKSHMENPY